MFITELQQVQPHTLLRSVGHHRDLYSLLVISALHIATTMAGYSILGFYPMAVMHSFKFIRT